MGDEFPGCVAGAGRFRAGRYSGLEGVAVFDGRAVPPTVERPVLGWVSLPWMGAWLAAGARTVPPDRRACF